MSDQCAVENSRVRSEEAPAASVLGAWEPRIIALERLDNWRNWLFLAADWLTIAVSGVAAASFSNPLTYLLAVLVIGSRQRALMNLVHEAAHQKLFCSRPVNDLAGRLLAAAPLFISLSRYRSEHCGHHLWLWDANRDPECRRNKRESLLTISLLVNRHRRSGAALSIVKSRLLAVNAAERRTLRKRIVPSLLWSSVLVVTASYVGVGALIVQYWLVPYLTAYQVIRYVAELAEHAGLETDDPWMGTRSWTAGLATRWVWASHSDDLFHLAHHLYPRIPHYNLKVAHTLLMDHLPRYAAAHHCDGLIWKRSVGTPSVMGDILGR